MIRNRIGWVFVAILLGLSSCYSLKLPSEYKTNEVCPYSVRKESDITYYSLDINSIRNIKDKILELTKAVEASEGKRTDPLEMIIIKGRSYKMIARDRLWQRTNGFYDIAERIIGLRDYAPGFIQKEQRTFIHEYIHFIDHQDNRTDLSEKEVEKKEKKISKNLGLTQGR